MLFILLFACATCAADATGEKIRQQIDAPVVPTTAKRWGYKTGAAVYSSPLVQTGGGSTGDVIFIGSQDKNVRGSLKLQSVPASWQKKHTKHSRQLYSCTYTCSPTVL